MIELGMILKILASPLLWVFIMGLFSILTVGVLWSVKQGKFKYPCYIIRNTGNDKIEVISGKSGWFKTNRFFFGLIDSGLEQELRVKIKRGKEYKVQCSSMVDMQEINGKKGFLFRRKEEDPNILVPISKVTLKGNEMLAEIAPADFRDASTQIIKNNEKELRNSSEIIMQHVITAMVVILAFIAVLWMMKYAKESIDQSWKYVKEAQGIVTGALPPSGSAP